MARKKEEDPPINTKAWMDTFGDMNNLLLCFYVLLFAMSTPNMEKITTFLASLQMSFSVLSNSGGLMGEGISSSFGVSSGVVQLGNLPQFIADMTGPSGESTGSGQDEGQGDQDDPSKSGSTAADAETDVDTLMEQLALYELKASNELAERIEEGISETAYEGMFEVSAEGDHVKIMIRGAIMFDSGNADIKPDAVPILGTLGVILEQYAEDLIEIEGHTDNVPMHNARFRNNAELSSARALSIFEYFVNNTSLDQSMIKYSGRGEYDPIADNSTEAGRARNRRVEINIYPALR